jgi:single stranded DNA-binding protein
MNANITVVGNIGKDPEIKFGKEGGAYTSLSIALPSRAKNGNEWVDGPTTWYKVSFFGAKAEQVCDTYGKGMRVKVTGQLLQGQPWTDKQGIHHDGSWEIGNAEIELAPWETKAKTNTSPPSNHSVTTPESNQGVTQSEVAPF